MLDHEQIDQLHWDEIPFVRSASYYETEDDSEENTIEAPLAEFQKKEAVDPTDAPEPLALLAKRAGVQAAVVEVAQAKAKEVPLMPPTSPYDSPEPMGAMKAMGALGLLAVARKREEEKEAPAPVEDPWFDEAPKYEAVVEPAPKKKGWFSSLKEKASRGLDRVMEKVGSFLDIAVPTVSAAAVAVTLGTLGSQLSDFNQVAKSAEVTSSSQSTVALAAPTLVQATTESVQFKAKTLAETRPDAASLNDLLVKKNTEIVQALGGSKASYLYSATAYADFIKDISKPGRGFTAVLSHPEVKTARTIAEMVNLVETHFGEKVADLVESNAAAMRLSASQIQSLR